MAGIISQLWGKNRPSTPRQVLPTDGWCTIDGIARMSLVWPWQVDANPQPLIDDHGRNVRVVPRLQLSAPRHDGCDGAFLVWSEQGATGVHGPEWGASMARTYPGCRIVSNQPLVLDGAMGGRVVRLADATTTHWRLVVPRHDARVLIIVTAPTAHADAYWLQVESMLATWGWDD